MVTTINGKKVKTGGRKKGVVNKTTAFNKAIISELLDEYKSSGLLKKDFLELEPKDRITIAEKLMNYTLPKMQSTSFDISSNTEECSIDIKLRQLAEQ